MSLKRSNEIPLVSICCIAYNQEHFIRKCLDGFLMQDINFPFEIIIHDDASTDRTADIIREYEAKHPKIIKPIYQTENQYSKLGRILVPFLFPLVKGKYVALCEGDDYWTDPLKLQKQVDFLEKNPDYSMCFHPVKVIYEDGSKPDEILPSPEQRFNKDILGLEDLLVRNFIYTNSVMYRWRFAKENVKDFFPKNILPGDWFLHMLHAQVGKIGYIDEVMAAYRRHAGGLWWESDKNADGLHLKYGIREINFYINVCKIFTNNSSEYFESKISPFARYLINLFSKHKELDKLGELFTLYADYCDSMIHDIQRKNKEMENKIRRKDMKIQKNKEELDFMKSSKFWRLRAVSNKIKFAFFSPVKFIKKYLSDN